MTLWEMPVIGCFTCHSDGLLDCLWRINAVMEDLAMQNQTSFDFVHTCKHKHAITCKFMFFFYRDGDREVKVTDAILKKKDVNYLKTSCKQIIHPSLYFQTVYQCKLLKQNIQTVILSKDFFGKGLNHYLQETFRKTRNHEN